MGPVRIAPGFFKLLCQSIPGAAKKLTIRKGSAYHYDKLLDLRTAKCMKIEKAKSNQKTESCTTCKIHNLKSNNLKFLSPK